MARRNPQPTTEQNAEDGMIFFAVHTALAKWHNLKIRNDLSFFIETVASIDFHFWLKIKWIPQRN